MLRANMITGGGSLARMLQIRLTNQVARPRAILHMVTLRVLGLGHRTDFECGAD